MGLYDGSMTWILVQDTRHHGLAFIYKSILEDELTKTIRYYGIDIDKVMFQHDNDSKHHAKSI